MIYQFYLVAPTKTGANLGSNDRFASYKHKNVFNKVTKIKFFAQLKFRTFFIVEKCYLYY